MNRRSFLRMLGFAPAAIAGASIAVAQQPQRTIMTQFRVIPDPAMPNLGAFVGAPVHTMSRNEMPAHVHSIHDPGHSHGLWPYPPGTYPIGRQYGACELPPDCAWWTV